MRVAALLALLLAVDPGSEAAKKIDEGQLAFDKGHFESALVAWETAYALDPAPTTALLVTHAYANTARASTKGSLERLKKWTSATRDPVPGERQYATNVVETIRLQVLQLEERVRELEGEVEIHVATIARRDVELQQSREASQVYITSYLRAQDQNKLLLKQLEDTQRAFQLPRQERP